VNVLPCLLLASLLLMLLDFLQVSSNAIKWLAKKR
jgi:hypothetical protein